MRLSFWKKRFNWRAHYENWNDRDYIELAPGTGIEIGGAKVRAGSCSCGNCGPTLFAWEPWKETNVPAVAYEQHP